MHHTPQVPLSPHHIIYIFAISPKLQVIDINTGPIVTPMQNMTALGNKAVFQRPRNTVGFIIPPLPLQPPISTMQSRQP